MPESEGGSGGLQLVALRTYREEFHLDLPFEYDPNPPFQLAQLCGLRLV